MIFVSVLTKASGHVVLTKRLSLKDNLFVFIKFSMYFTYILYSRCIDKFYKGHSINPNARLFKHNNKDVRSTKHGTPWILVWCSSKATRVEAVQLELKLKNLTRERLIIFMLKYSEDLINRQILMELKKL